jgi:hypothetical protein
MVDAITDLSGLGLLSLKDTGSNPVRLEQVLWGSRNITPMLVFKLKVRIFVTTWKDSLIK